MSTTSLQSCAYKYVFTSDKAGQQVFCKTRRTVWSDLLVAVLVAAVLLFSEIGRKPLDPENLDFHEVASRLMPTSHEPYRAPLRIVTFRKPTGHPHPSEPSLISISVRETLECGHKVTVFPGEHEPLIAKRRRCQECAAAVIVASPKKPVQSERRLVRREEPRRENDGQEESA
ncbi:MAG TPA: hypothetical protein VHX11_08760 [Acidobacteriaceae bacterium]|jgi:hypothetical protein|nr:hypothetical protein [Acidobacteriaceae bacterium]